jgi:hypothetical protein
VLRHIIGRSLKIVAAAALVFALTPLPAHALDDTARPTARATRIDVADAPTIDGDISDAVWARAQVITEEFRQVEPVAGEVPTERTEVRILYDANNLYFAINMLDSEPEQIVARIMTRDGNLATGDNFRLYLDPNLTRRNAYVFEIGPTGGRMEGLLQNNQDLLTEWDALWTARARRTATGWTGEIAIPFASLSYTMGGEGWGLDFLRLVRRKAERIRWTSQSPTIPFNDISRAGTLTGIGGVDQGVGLDVQLYGRLRYKHDWRPEPGHGSLSGTGSANAYYKVTPALTGTATINPDFSDSPLDERQVNTTRFSLFFPETRDFFLQDAGAFEFGGRDFVNGQFAQNAPNARPFFSRNIGLVNGRPVTILGGGKLSGQVGDLGIGALSVVTNETSVLDRQLLSAARITKPVLGQSKVGFIVTNGDPTGRSDNTLVGTDFQYRNSNVFGGNTLQADMFYERSVSDVFEDDDAFGAVLYYPNEPIGGELRFKEIGEDFHPALGFANRPGIRDYGGALTHMTRFRGRYLRDLQFGTAHTVVTGLDNEVQSRFSRAWTRINTRNIDTAAFDLYNYYENVPAPFSLPGGVIVPAGRYEWTNVRPFLDTTQGRDYVLTTSVECCSFYNGDYLKADVTFIWRPTPQLEFTPRWTGTWIDLPTGSVDIHVLSMNTVFNFTPDMQFLMQMQYDNISDSFGFSARYRWEYSPGNDLFIAFGQSALIPGTDLQLQTSQISVRLGRTFRF